MVFVGYASLVRPSHREVSKRLSGSGPERPLPLSYSDALGHEPVGDLKRERSAEHKSRCVALYCIFKGYCDELPSCRGQTSNTPPKRELNGSESIGRPVLRSARSGRGVERASREFCERGEVEPPPPETEEDGN